MHRNKFMFKPSFKVEKHFFTAGYKLIAGIDEVGRAPLAGPVVAAAVVLPKNFRNFGVRDSKTLLEHQREKLAIFIKKKALAYSIGMASVDLINKINITQAAFVAMRQALENLKLPPEIILIDGMLTIPKVNIPQLTITYGDRLVTSIAAASIIAKVYRDNLMKDYHKEFPQYGFHLHKGYSTKLHQEAIKKFGPTPLHRNNFGIVKKIGG